MSWEIKSKNNEVKFEVGKVEYNDEWMQERYVTVTIESPVPINFQIGDYLIYRDERFEINYDPGKIKSAPRFEKGDAFKYENVKFNSLADELTRCDFLDVVLGDNQLHFTGLPKVTFYGGVLSLAERIQANLDRAYGKDVWCVEVDTEFSSDTELNVSIDTQKVSGVLADVLVNQFKTYYTIKGRTLTIGAAGVPADHLFKYGPGQGLYEIEENAEADQQIVTRLRAYGSTRNIPHRYYNSLTDADGEKLIPDNMAVQYLMLPEFPYTTQDPYIDSKNIDTLGVREGTIFFDGSGELEEIYPSIEGMTAEQLIAAGVPCNAIGALDVLVSAEQMTDNGVGIITGEPLEGTAQTEADPKTFKVKIKDVGFDINNHLTTEAATISFKSGMLGGRDFEIVGCTPVKDTDETVTGYELELNRVYDDDIKLWFPYKDYNAKGTAQNAEKPDKFVLLNIKMPEVYIKAASQLLKERAQAWLDKNDYSRSIYNPKIDEIFMARQHDAAMASGGTIKSLHDNLCAGMLLLFEDEDLGIDAAIFIDRLTIIEGEGQIPTYEVTLKEEKTVGRLDKIQNQIDSLAAGQGQGGNYTALQIRNHISAYGSQMFLSKVKDDRSAGKIASDTGFEVGDFLAGVSGAMVGLDIDTEKTFVETDYIYARVKAYFESLTIIEANNLAGKQYIAPGGGIKCVKVEDVKNAQGNVTAYRCYFLSEQDGEKSYTKIIANDQVICEQFNIEPGTSDKATNHRYWRLVTAVNNDAYTDDSGNHYGYIELSETDCEENSDIPKEGDIIDQFGNRDDATRQAAMVFSTVDADAPSIKLFKGINSYTLAGKDVISYGYDTVKGNAYIKCYGDIYFGARDGSTLVRYNQQETNFELLNVTQKVTSIVDGIHTTLSGTNGIYDTLLKGKTIGTWWGGDMVDKFYDENGDTRPTPLESGFATSLIRLDGSAYFGGGMHAFNADGTGWLGGYEKGIRFDKGAMTFGNGIKIDLGDGKDTTLGGISDTLANIFSILNGLATHIVPVVKNPDGTKVATTWDVINTGTPLYAVKSIKGFYTDEFLSAKGLNDSGEGTGGGGGGGLAFGRLDSWDAYDAERGDALSAVLGYGMRSDIDALSAAQTLLDGKFSLISNNVSLLDDRLNLLSASLDDCLPLTGGTMTGAITFENVNPAFIIKRGNNLTPYFRFVNSSDNSLIGEFGGRPSDNNPVWWRNDAWQTLWHSGNDGEGSGLDADLLDGKHLTDILNSNVASATKLATPRSIFGVSGFDGTADLPKWSKPTFRYLKLLGHNNETEVGFIGCASQYFYDLYIRTYGTSNIRIGTGSSDDLYISNAHQIGVKTIYPAYDLDVNGTARFRSTLAVTDTASFSSDIEVLGGANIHELLWLGDDLSVDGSASIQGTLKVYGDITLWGVQTLLGNTHVNQIFFLPGTPDVGEKAPYISGYSQKMNFAFHQDGTWYSTPLTLTPEGAMELNGVFHATTGIYSDGYLSGRGQQEDSDERLKEILGNLNLDLRDIATAPCVAFRWRDTGELDFGSIAQHFGRINPLFTAQSPKGTLTMDYGKLALVYASENARRTIALEQRVEKLESLINQ